MKFHFLLSLTSFFIFVSRVDTIFHPSIVVKIYHEMLWVAFSTLIFTFFGVIHTIIGMFLKSIKNLVNKATFVDLHLQVRHLKLDR